MFTARGRFYIPVALIALLFSSAALGQDFESLSMPAQVSKLIAAGGMGGPLDSTGSNYTAEGNASMWSAMSAWNAHDWDTAVKRLKDHAANFPDDPWTGEATLHLACHAFYTKNYTSAEECFKWVADTYSGKEVAAKALARLGPTYFLQGRLEDAAATFGKVLKESTSWDDRTYAHSWLLKISQTKVALLASGNYGECGRDSLKVAFEILGDGEKAGEISKEKVTNLQGLTMEEVRLLSEKYGRRCWGAKVAAAEIVGLPVPFIARFGSHHFVVVKSVSKGEVAYFDPFIGERKADLASFARSFPGEVLVFSDPQEFGGKDSESEGLKVTLLTTDEMSAIRGGCCGARLPASGPCPDKGEDPEKCCEGGACGDGDDGGDGGDGDPGAPPPCPCQSGG